MYVDTIRAFAAVRTGLDFFEEVISTEELTITINAIQSKVITPKEQAPGHSTRRELKKMDTRDKWEAGERKKLNQFRDLKCMASLSYASRTRSSCVRIGNIT